MDSSKKLHKKLPHFNEHTEQERKLTINSMLIILVESYAKINYFNVKSPKLLIKHFQEGRLHTSLIIGLYTTPTVGTFPIVRPMETQTKGNLQIV